MDALFVRYARNTQLRTFHSGNVRRKSRDKMIYSVCTLVYPLSYFLRLFAKKTFSHLKTNCEGRRGANVYLGKKEQARKEDK